MAAGNALDSGAAKTGTGGGRVGVVGGAFSLSMTDSWVEVAAVSGSCSGLGAAGTSALEVALASTGGLGNSWIICAGQRCGRSLADMGAVSPHRDGPEYTAVSAATRRCPFRLAMLTVAAACWRHSRVERAVFGSLLQYRLRCERSVSSLHSAHMSRACARHLPDVILPAREGGF